METEDGSPPTLPFCPALHLPAALMQPARAGVAMGTECARVWQRHAGENVCEVNRTLEIRAVPLELEGNRYGLGCR